MKQMCRRATPTHSNDDQMKERGVDETKKHQPQNTTVLWRGLAWDVCSVHTHSSKHHLMTILFAFSFVYHIFSKQHKYLCFSISPGGKRPPLFLMSLCLDSNLFVSFAHALEQACISLQAGFPPGFEGLTLTFWLWLLL